MIHMKQWFMLHSYVEILCILYDRPGERNAVLVLVGWRVLMGVANVQSVEFFMAHVDDVIKSLFNDLSAVEKLFFGDTKRGSKTNDIDMSGFGKKTTGLE